MIKHIRRGRSHFSLDLKKKDGCRIIYIVHSASNIRLPFGEKKMSRINYTSFYVLVVILLCSCFFPFPPLLYDVIRFIIQVWSSNYASDAAPSKSA